MKNLNNLSNILSAAVLLTVCMLQNTNAVAAETLIQDNGDPGTSSNGRWRTSDGDDPYGSNSLYARDAGTSYTFNLELATPGEYQLYAWWTEDDNRRTSVPIDISHQTGTSTVNVDQQDDGGKWQKLDTWTFGNQASVTIRSLGDGTTSADAIKLVYVGNDTAVSAFPVDLRDSTPEEASIVINVSKPDNVVDAIITLATYDADFSDEGELIINGNVPVKLFGGAGISGNDNNSASISFNTPASYWRNGDNTLLFRHLRTKGYIIDAATVSFELSQNVPNDAPVLASIGDKSVTAGATLNFNISATDSDSTVPILEASGLPAYAQFYDLYNGTGSFTISPAQTSPTGMQNITFIARDAQNPVLTDSETITISIVAASVGGNTGSASLSWTPPIEREDGTALSLSEISGYTVYYGASSGNYTKSLNINDGFATSATITDLPPGSHYMVVTTRDFDGRESSYSSEAVIFIN